MTRPDRRTCPGEECRAASDELALGWRSYLAHDPDDPSEEPLLAFYCPQCSVKEFGGLSRADRKQTD